MAEEEKKQELDREEESQEKQKEEKQFPKKQFIWIILGIAAILLIWLLSSWVY